MRQYPLYKGLGKPLVYRGFKGKFILWSISSLILGIVIGGSLTAMAGPIAGLLSGIAVIAAGISYTFFRQKQGLHDKKRYRGIIIQPAKLKIYEKKCI